MQTIQIFDLPLRTKWRDKLEPVATVPAGKTTATICRPPQDADILLYSRDGNATKKVRAVILLSGICAIAILERKANGAAEAERLANEIKMMSPGISAKNGKEVVDGDD